MHDALGAEIVQHIHAVSNDEERLLVAIAGPPGAGKSTVAEKIVTALNTGGAARCALLPMDGYHYDNTILEQRGLLTRKGAPETFNASGLLADLHRIREGKDEVAVAMFDRAADRAYANALLIAPDQPMVVVEGNYLLLDRPIWREIAKQFDLTVMITVADAELERRLVQRWQDHGLDREAALRRAQENDLANARTVVENSVSPDLTVRN